MKPTELNDWLQVVGLFGVIASLIFVGLQLKQDRRIALAEVMSAASESSKYWAELVNDNADVWTKGLHGDELSDVETHRFNALADAFFLRWQAAWTRAHQLEPALKTRFAREAATHIHQNPGLRRYWRARSAAQTTVDIDALDAGPASWSAAVDKQLSAIESELE